MIQKARSELLLHPAKFEKPHNGATYECGQTSKKQDKHKFIGGNMLERKLTLPELGLLAGTRVALGIGIGLLLSAGWRQKKAATPFSAAAVASPPDTAAGGKSSNSCPESASRGFTHLWRTSLIEKIAIRKVSCKDFLLFCGA
jgi:hypothetical protein